MTQRHLSSHLLDSCHPSKLINAGYHCELKSVYNFSGLVVGFMTRLLQIVDAIISHGCFLRECSVQHSIVGVRSRLESGVELMVSQLFFPSSLTHLPTSRASVSRGDFLFVVN